MLRAESSSRSNGWSRSEAGRWGTVFVTGPGSRRKNDGARGPSTMMDGAPSSSRCPEPWIEGVLPRGAQRAQNPISLLCVRPLSGCGEVRICGAPRAADWEVPRGAHCRVERGTALPGWPWLTAPPSDAVICWTRDRKRTSIHWRFARKTLTSLTKLELRRRARSPRWNCVWPPDRHLRNRGDLMALGRDRRRRKSASPAA